MKQESWIGEGLHEYRKGRAVCQDSICDQVDGEIQIRGQLFHEIFVWGWLRWGAESWNRESPWKDEFRWNSRCRDASVWILAFRFTCFFIFRENCTSVCNCEFEIPCHLCMNNSESFRKGKTVVSSSANTNEFVYWVLTSLRKNLSEHVLASYEVISAWFNKPDVSL